MPRLPLRPLRNGSTSPTEHAHVVSRGANAYPEGVQTKIKLMKCSSNGFRNVPVSVKKMLLAFLPPLQLTLYRGGPHFSAESRPDLDFDFRQRDNPRKNREIMATGWSGDDLV